MKVIVFNFYYTNNNENDYEVFLALAPSLGGGCEEAKKKKIYSDPDPNFTDF